MKMRGKTILPGLCQLARWCGVSHTHLRACLLGDRIPSEALSNKLTELMRQKKLRRLKNGRWEIANMR